MDPPEAGGKGTRTLSPLHTHTAGADRSSTCLFADDNKNSLNSVLRREWGGGGGPGRALQASFLCEPSSVRPSQDRGRFSPLAVHRTRGPRRLLTAQHGAMHQRAWQESGSFQPFEGMRGLEARAQAKSSQS